MQSLRYGDDGKDYFWISDMHPRMIVHPYRPELNGQDLSEYSDRAGKRLFVEFTRLVRADGAGYSEYLWQWKDDERRIVPKLSYVKGFEPWGWIIGTGIYLEDVRVQMSDITRRVIWMSLGFSVLIAGLLVYMTKQSLDLERSDGRGDRAPGVRGEVPDAGRGHHRGHRPGPAGRSSTETARCSRCWATTRPTWRGSTGNAVRPGPGVRGADRGGGRRQRVRRPSGEDGSRLDVHGGRRRR